jgi:ABC-type amino acid transport substrate-binding protein
MRAFLPLTRKSYYRSRAVTSDAVSRASWLKSGFSQLNGSCVEIGRLLPDRIGVRDTKDNGTGPMLVFTAAEWDAFIAGAKAGHFDNL